MANRAIQRYSDDLIRVVTVSVFLLGVAYVYHGHINLDVVFRFTIIERIFGVVIATFVLGRIASKVGTFLADAMIFLFFQRDRWEMVKKGYENLRDRIGFGGKHVGQRGDYITFPEIVHAIGSHNDVKELYGQLVSEQVFWTTVSGMLLFASPLFFNSYLRWFFIIAFFLSLPLSIHARYRRSKFIYDCATNVARERAKSESPVKKS